MVTAATDRTHDSLNSFIARVSSFPLSARQLVEYAASVRAPKEVIEFYKKFTPDRIFEDKEDLSASTEQVDILRREEPGMPREEERSPEEY